MLRLPASRRRFEQVGRGFFSPGNLPCSERFFLAGKSPKLRGLYCKLAGKINGTYRETMGNLSINGGFNGKIHYEGL